MLFEFNGKAFNTETIKTVEPAKSYDGAPGIDVYFMGGGPHAGREAGMNGTGTLALVVAVVAVAISAPAAAQSNPLCIASNGEERIRVGTATCSAGVDSLAIAVGAGSAATAAGNNNTARAIGAGSTAQATGGNDNTATASGDGSEAVALGGNQTDTCP